MHAEAVSVASLYREWHATGRLDSWSINVSTVQRPVLAILRLDLEACGRIRCVRLPMSKAVRFGIELNAVLHQGGNASPEPSQSHTMRSSHDFAVEPGVSFCAQTVTARRSFAPGAYDWV